MPSTQYPAAARHYAYLSPDIYCGTHLKIWTEERGQTLESYKEWLLYRLDIDRQSVLNLDGSLAESIEFYN